MRRRVDSGANGCRRGRGCGAGQHGPARERAGRLVFDCVLRDRALVRQRTAHDSSLPLFQHCYGLDLRAFSSMKVKSDWLKKSSGFMSGGRTCRLTALA